MRDIGYGVRRAAFATAVALVLAACGPPPPPGVVYVERRPPPERAEVIPIRPGPGFVWIRGFWRWDRGDYFWVPGHWTAVQRGHHHWVPGHWRHSRRGWFYVEGYWR
jgi:hypothetical protein